MIRFTAKGLGLCGCLLIILGAVPVQASPFFVTVYGRTYKVDPRLPSDKLKGPKPQEALQALPSDIATGPGFRPSHEQVLADVEERTWIARNLLADELAESSFSREGRYAGADVAEAEAEIPRVSAPVSATFSCTPATTPSAMARVRTPSRRGSHGCCRPAARKTAVAAGLSGSWAISP